MAGNTKLMGFAPNGKIQLERWGKSVEVKISNNSMKLIRDICTSELPTHPPDPPGGLSDANAGYNSAMGRVFIELTPRLAEEVASILDDMRTIIQNDATLELPGQIRRAVVAHKEFVNRDEPGLQ